MEIGLFSPRANVPVSGGPAGLDSWCVVTSDPTGVLIKAAGTTAYHIDGVRFWLNLTGTAAGWIAAYLLTPAQYTALLTVATRELNGLSGTFGINCTAFDTPTLDCDTKGDCAVILRGQSATNSNGILSLRINGSTLSIDLSGHSGLSDAAPALFGAASSSLFAYNVAGALANCPFGIVLICRNSASGRFRQWDLSCYVSRNPTVGQITVLGAQVTFKSNAELDSVGVETTIANDLEFSSIYRVVRL